MKRSSVVLALAAVLLSAMAVAAEEKKDGTFPEWIEKPLEAANPYVSAGSDLYGGASGAIEATKAMRTGDVARTEGNRALRHAKAMEHNAALKTGRGYIKAVERFQVGPAMTVADVGSVLTAQLLEGDFRSIPGVVANTAVKNAATSSGAWAVGTAGAAAGSFFGPVGTLVGGAVGAGLGALGVSWGYDAAGEALKANGYRDVQGYVDALMAEPERAGFRQAQQNRREWLMERGLAPLVGGDADFVKPVPLPQEPAAGATSASASTSSLIPEDCVIETVFSNHGGPEQRHTMRISQGAAWFHTEDTQPARVGENVRTSPTRQVQDFTGRLRDNVVSGTARETTSSRTEQWWVGVPQHCMLDVSSESTIEEEWTFLPGGQGRLRFAGHYKVTRRYGGGCPYKPGGTETDEGELAAGNATFTWRLQ
jgi:hypothetical protein